MDPQERLFLESCYHAIEDAGYTPETLGDIDKIGVFAGVMNARYNSQPLYYSIANRVSYVFNFQGPSMAVDTACSSSLTAIHLALESLYSGLSECAIAGGVNLIIDPVHYVELSAFTMLSEGNECKSFGDGADGFVDAEGVGAVVMKPLWKAEQDGDHIYGVIKASAVNAGGKTNGYTVPNPKAQSAVVARALQRANLDPTQLSYIEAHGTGTSLGDPIEIAGLTRAFEQWSKERQFCAIGSLKSNIGHCESAAGIAALTKVLLQLKHKQLVPSLHAEVTNQEINFSQTPFRVQKRLEDWVRPVREVHGVMQEIPRLAGISSFGAGGANAHLIVQEYEAAKPAAAVERSSPVIIPLSARTNDQVVHKARDLLHFVRAAQREREALDLAAMAYTLQVGREPMEERLGFVVASVKELEDKLDVYLKGEQAAEGISRGRVKHHQETRAADADMQETVAKWIVDRDLAKLLDAWVKGFKIDWNSLNDAAKPNRISLPMYPFARERYWRERTDVSHTASKPARDALLHPLLHRNVSDIRHQCYRSTFAGNEFFVADQQTGGGVAGQKVIPAMVYLEMARAAVENAAPPGKTAAGRIAMELFDIVWADPAVATGGKQVSVALFAQDDHRLSYEVFSSDDGGEEIVHCQGRALLSSEYAPAKVDLERLRSQMRQGKRDAATLHKSLSNGGVHHALAYQGVKSLHLGEKQLLADLAIPAAIADDATMVASENLVLHPIIMDGALQAAGDLLSPTHQRSLPLALDSLPELHPCSKEMFAWVRRAQEADAEDPNIRLDIDLCDRQGNICVQLRGLAYEGAPPHEAESTSEAAPLSIVRERFPAVSLADADVALTTGQSQGFAVGACAKPEISLVTAD
jgi:polyketide synthase PksM